VPPWNAVGASSVGGTPASGPQRAAAERQLRRKLNSACASAPRTATNDSAARSTRRSPRALDRLCRHHTAFNTHPHDPVFNQQYNRYRVVIIIISLLMSPLLGDRPSLWITHKKNRYRENIGDIESASQKRLKNIRSHFKGLVAYIDINLNLK
jgi:hypothetical protein